MWSSRISSRYPRSHASLRHTGGPGRSPTSSLSGVVTRIWGLRVGGDGLPRLLPAPNRLDGQGCRDHTLRGRQGNLGQLAACGLVPAFMVGAIAGTPWPPPVVPNTLVGVGSACRNASACLPCTGRLATGGSGGAPCDQQFQRGVRVGGWGGPPMGAFPCVCPLHPCPLVGSREGFVRGCRRSLVLQGVLLFLLFLPL